MSDPTKYTRDYSFTDYQASNPSAPLPGLQVDAELEDVEASIGEIVDAIKDVRRSDGKLKNGIVTVDSLDPTVAAGVGSGALASAEAAAASADAAASSAVAAASSAGSAAGSANTAATSAGQAMTYRNQASGSADDSAAAASLAQTARDFAHQWATAASAVNVSDGVNPVGKSSYHWAQVALAAASGSIPSGSSTQSEIAALDTNLSDVALLTAGVARRKGRFGVFRLENYSDWSDIVTIDPLQGFVIRSTFDPDKVWVRQSDYVSPFQFGAVGDATAVGVGTNDTAAIEAARDVAFALQKTLLVDGKFRYAPSAAWDMPTQGGHVSGTNWNEAVIYLDVGSTLEIGGTGGGKFWGSFGNMWVVGNNSSGPVFRAGSEDFTSAVLNSYDFKRLRVNNSAAVQDGPIGVQINYVLETNIDIKVNMGGSGNPLYGTGFGLACEMRQVVMCRGSIALGNCRTALRYSGFNNGNHFNGVDIEEAYYGVTVDHANSIDLFLTGGKIVAFYPINATNGRRNGTKAVNYTAYSGGAIFAPGGYFWNVEGANYVWNSVSRPASTVAWVNDTGRRVLVRAVGAITVATVNLRSGASYGVPITAADQPINELVEPGGSITLTYTGTPGWQVRPLD